MDWFELIKLGLSFVLAAIGAAYLTPMVRNAAIRFGIVDNPDGVLKTHKEPVAYLGGLAIFISLLATLSLAYTFNSTALGILLGTSMIIALGLIDDFGVLTPKVKLMGQFIAVWTIYKGGISVQIVWLPEWANLIITVIWIIGVTNAFNLIDVMDGLASGTALIAAVFLAIISFLNGNFLLTAFAIVLAGSLGGFLPYNFKPAKIFLGDTGSMSIGFILAALTINEQYTLNNSWIGVLAPLVIMGVPLFETAFLIVVRLAKRIHPLKGSPDHFALRLKRKGWGVERIVISTYAAGILLGICGLILVYAPLQIAVAALAVTAVLALIFTVFILQEDFKTKETAK